MKASFLLLILLLFFIFYPQIENFTSCNNLNAKRNPPYTCNDCVNAPVTGAGYPCLWNNRTKKCGSFADKGYSKVCPKKSWF